jgi:protein O-GlcNAc transferase
MNEILLRSGYSEYQRGNFAEAARLYVEVLRVAPAHVDALCLLGILRAQQGEVAEANVAADQALNAGTATAAGYYKIGCLLQILGRHEDAKSCFDKTLAATPSSFEALTHRGISAMALEDSSGALAFFDKAVALRPQEAGAWLNRGNAFLQLGRNEEAISSYDRALGLNPAFGEAWENRGKGLTALGRKEDALISYDRAIGARPGSVTAWNLRGAALLALRRFEDSAANSESVLSAQPDNIIALMNRGVAYDRLLRHEDALADFDRVIVLDPLNREVLFQRANALNGLKRHAESLVSVGRFLEHKPDDADALVTKGVALQALGTLDEALLCYDHALTFTPDCIEALINRAEILANKKRFEEAAADYDRAVALDPTAPYLACIAAQYRLHCCDWGRYTQDREAIAKSVAAGEKVVPFINLVFSSSPQDQLVCARKFVADALPHAGGPLWRGERYEHDRIRLAYVSADFRHHPMSHLMAGVFEAHDRQRFEMMAISFGPDDGSPVRKRIENGFEHFLDLRDASPRQIAELMHRRQIDIVVDLMGFTSGARAAIFAMRPAPVQVSYLGYPGTMGAGYIDYILADRIVIPGEEKRFYQEAVVYLPDTYYPNDSKRPVAATVPSRSEVGLPEKGFVFCCFNSSQKLTPAMFEIWMRLLRSADGSVLWLLSDTDVAARNLRREAQAHGVSPDRLVFAPRIDPDPHLARHRLADLSLDTLPYNAHTTTCDALWMGVPVVTCPGTTFVGRVAASVLLAVGLPELVTHSLGEYEALALKLARDPQALASIRAKLATNRATYPLFDTARLTHNLEAAYTTMWQRAQQGAPAESFAVRTGAL